MAKLTPVLQTAEIVLRVIALALQVMPILGGVLLLALPPPNLWNIMPGVAFIAIGSLKLVYEIVMFIFAAKNSEDCNHSKRLRRDYFLNGILAAPCLFGTWVTFVYLVLVLGLVYAIAVVIFGMIYSCAYIVSAVTSRRIYSKLNSVATAQPIGVVVARPPTVVVPQQPQVQSSDDPRMGYTEQTSFSDVPVENPGEYQAGSPEGGLHDPNSITCDEWSDAGHPQFQE